jgi:hypothetical protein
MFDITLQAVGLDVAAPDEEALEAGAPPLLNYIIVAGQMLPIQGPDGQPVRIPAAQLRFALPKDVSLDFAQIIADQADKLPDLKESDLIIANNLQGVEGLAKQMEDISKGKT